MTTGLAPVASAQTRRQVAARGEQHCDPVDLDSSTGSSRIVGWTVVTVTDDYLANNADYAKSFDGPLPLPPSKHVAVLACMDARIDVYRVLGINEGESHVIRNAGGVVTDDAIRSLAISQRLLGTTEIILIHHTDCGMLTFNDDDFKRAIQDETGVKPPWSAEAFPDLAEDVRQSLQRIENSPFVTKHTSARGFIFDVATGKLDEVTG
jgi:carbonic anhydrase